jgi:hypothetical protein
MAKPASRGQLQAARSRIRKNRQLQRPEIHDHFSARRSPEIDPAGILGKDASPTLMESSRLSITETIAQRREYGQLVFGPFDSRQRGRGVSTSSRWWNDFDPAASGAARGIQGFDVIPSCRQLVNRRNRMHTTRASTGI